MASPSDEEPRSALRMLKRSWSTSERRSQSPEKPLAPTTPSTPMREVDGNIQAGVTHTIKQRKFDESWTPFLTNRVPQGASVKGTLAVKPSSKALSSATLDSLVRPLARTSRSPSPVKESVYVPEENRMKAKVFLSPEQQRVLEAVVQQGQSVFFTGSAGAGKSHLLRQIIRDLREKYRLKSDAVAVTASTGIAACNIGGITLHSFGGVGLAKETPERLLTVIRRNRKATTRWMRTQVLIIDEISMIDPKLFDKLEQIARMLRKSTKPFGGIQIVATGDFFQLPPVSPGGDVQFVFESAKWHEVIQKMYNLTQVFRQKDQTFVRMLNEMRMGKLSADTVQAFAKLERVPELPEGITPTELYPLRRDVEKANRDRLDALPSELRVYTSLDGGTLPPDQRERVLENFMAPRYVHLKKGAQVMLIKNLFKDLANGSVGTVIDFMDESTYLDTYGEDSLRIDVPEDLLSNAERAPGATRSTHAGNDKDARPAARWPLVRFHLPNGLVRDQLVRPETWKNEEPNGDVVASRTQIPIMLAWAMSIHKSQGQTLPWCRIDLRRVFEKGQAYVALSRATSLDSLQVIGFQPSKVMAHPKVIRWNQNQFGSTSLTT